MSKRGGEDEAAGVNTGAESAEAVEQLNAQTDPVEFEQLLSGLGADDDDKASAGEIEQSPSSDDDDTPTSTLNTPKSSAQSQPEIARRRRPSKTEAAEAAGVPPEALTAPIDAVVPLDVGHVSYSALSPEEQAQVLALLNKFQQDLQASRDNLQPHQQLNPPIRPNSNPATTTTQSTIKPKPKQPKLSPKARATAQVNGGGGSGSQNSSGSIGAGGTTGNRRDTRLFPYLRGYRKLNHAPIDPATGKPMTVEAYRKSFTNCFYCDKRLYHEYTNNDRRDEIKSRDRSILEHVYSNDLAIEYAPDGGAAEQEAQQIRAAGGTLEREIKPPEWWNNYTLDARGLVSACFHCNVSKGTKSIKEWNPTYLRKGAKEEAVQKYEFIKKEYGFSGP